MTGIDRQTHTQIHIQAHNSRQIKRGIDSDTHTHSNWAKIERRTEAQRERELPRPLHSQQDGLVSEGSSKTCEGSSRAPA